jgi:hypothetical protein
MWGLPGDVSECEESARMNLVLLLHWSQGLGQYFLSLFIFPSRLNYFHFSVLIPKCVLTAGGSTSDAFSL